MYGNYCGPYWSDGQYQQSVVGSRLPANELDAICQRHDESYARHQDLRAADLLFAKDAFSKGVLGKLFAAPVYIQGLLRTDTTVSKQLKKLNSIDPSLTMTKTNTNKQSLRKVNNVTKNMASTNHAPIDALTNKVGVAASYGATIYGSKPIVQNMRNGVRVRHTDFISSVSVYSNTNFEVGAVVPLHPAYWSGTTLANICRSYAKYRFHNLSLSYVTAVSSGTAGDVVLTVNYQVLEPAINIISNTAFLANALSQSSSVLTSIWRDVSVGVECDSIYRLCDPLAGTDIDDQIFGELIAYGQCNATGVAGYVLASYDIECLEPMYTLHSALIPLPAASVGYGTFTDSANETAANAAIITGTTGLNPNAAPFVDGFIFKAVLVADNTSFATGTSRTNSLSISTIYNTNSTTSLVRTGNVTLVNGSVIWLKLENSLFVMYGSLEGAILGNSEAVLTYQSTVAFKTVWAFYIYPAHYSAYTAFQSQ